MDKQMYVVGVAVFILAAAGSYFVGGAFFSEPQIDRYHSFHNVTADADNNVRPLSFDGKEIDLMYESTESFRAYLDTDQDGSFDIELKDLVHDGELHTKTQVVTFNRTSYTLYFRYKDFPDRKKDGFIRLFQVKEL